MDVRDQQQSTFYHMYGEWEFKREGLDIHILISKIWRNVTLTVNGEKEEFSSSAHWVGDHHLDFLYKGYFVRYADESQLIFGKLRTPNVGDNEWEYSFNRVKPQN